MAIGWTKEDTVTYIDAIILEAARMPPRDAAFHLWSHRSQIARLGEPPPRSPYRGADLSEPAVFAQVVKSAIATVWEEQANAHDGPTFARLKVAHPDARDSDLKDAIKAAVKLDQDCLRHFDYRNENYLDDVIAAVEAARCENPGFREMSYAAAGWGLAREMR